VAAVIVSSEDINKKEDTREQIVVKMKLMIGKQRKERSGTLARKTQEYYKLDW